MSVRCPLDAWRDNVVAAIRRTIGAVFAESGGGATAAPSIAITIASDASFEALIRLFEDLAQVPLELGERLLDLFDATSDRFRIQVDGTAAPGTILLGVRLAPQFADSLREFATAVRARDFDLFFVEHSEVSVVGGVTTSTITERGRALNARPQRTGDDE